MITFKFEDAKFQNRFHAVITNTKNPKAVLLNAGREVANTLKAHFREKDENEPNHLSDRRQHYWQRIAQSVSVPTVDGLSVTVTIADPTFAQKVFGGTIRAKAAGALTIPEEERAYGRTAATFERETGLKLILIKIGGSKANPFENAVLAVRDDPNSKTLTVEYLLTKSVHQKADTDALPDKTALENAIIARCQRVVDRENQNPGTAAAIP